MSDRLVTVDRLAVRFPGPDGPVRAVEDVSLHLDAGETLGVVGESGSGKSVTARSLMRLLPDSATVTAGRLSFRDLDLLAATREQMRRVRGAAIAMVYQDPNRALNPTMRIGDQIGEAIRAHDRSMDRPARRRRVIELLDAVRIPGAAQRAADHPHQLSGGMRQRVVIAMALASDPEVLIADEPTTALDVTVQAQILDLLTDLQTERGMGMILVTHDLGVAAWHTDRVAVMYAGRVVEEAPTDRLFGAMRMPYTRALFDSIPRLEDPPHAPIRSIPGRPPARVGGATGCAFQPRCDQATERCAEQVPALVHDGPHGYACWHPLPAGDGTAR